MDSNGQENTVELEEYARADKAVPEAKHYAFRVDKTRVVVDTPVITGAEILEKAGKTPAGFKLYEHIRGQQPILIPPDKKVDLRDRGVERFTTMPKDTTEGLDDRLTRDFRLPEADEEYLNGLGLVWETIKHGDNRWLVIRQWTLPDGYNHRTTDLALLIPANYSDSQIDMVYFREHLARTDGRAIGALAMQDICGAHWQRWSRHRTGANPWRPGVDDVASHLGLIDEWLRREFAKAA
jgi:hypothetical protein